MVCYAATLRIAPNTFRRVVKAHELLKSDAEVRSKRRLAFAKAHVNELWQADTMVGPYAQQGAGKVQAKLIAFLDDSSRVVCHGEFFATDTTETLLASSRQHSTNEDSARCCTWTTAATTHRSKSRRCASDWAPSCVTHPCAMVPRRARSSASSAPPGRPF